MKTPVFAALLLTACQPAAETPFASPVQIRDLAIAEPLEGKAGDADRGYLVFTARDQGHCVLCHAVDSIDLEFQGNVGPPLTGLGSRLSAAEIRYRIIGAQQIWPETVMPSYYRVEGLNRVGLEFQGHPALSAQQIEDLVAYLSSLKASNT